MSGIDIDLLRRDECRPLTTAQINEIKSQFHPSNIVNVNVLFPVGAILPMSGNLAPNGFLPCDGRVVNIEDYPNLANYYEQAQGSKNFYGGDGTTTFAVPDLRGEFLRGSGTNSHENQGSGANVGVHQDGTEIPQIVGGSGKIYISDTNSRDGIKNPDSMISNVGYVGGASGTSGSASYAFNTTRPTNTSVLYCVKY